MRTLLLLSLTLPFFSNAQVNRSAREFAIEQIQEYIVAKLFKGQPYKPGAFGELKPAGAKNSAIAWSLIHQFEITETRADAYAKTTVLKPLNFIFLLDNKMKVQKAQVFFSY
jgi:hypothetical protein